MKKCPKCNFENQDNSQFCQNCGAKLNLQQDRADITNKLDFINFSNALKNIPGYDAWGTKKEIKHLYSILYDEECVYSIASGVMGGNTWLVACTNIRIIFVDCGLIYGVKQSEILIDKINSVSYKNGIILGEIQIQDGASVKIISNVQKYSTKPFVDAVYKAINERKMKNNMPSSLSVADEILKLKSLMDSGIITENEFNEQKRKLLNL